MNENEIARPTCTVVRKNGERFEGTMSVVVSGDNINVDNFTDPNGEPITLYSGDSIEINGLQFLEIK